LSFSSLSLGRADWSCKKTLQTKASAAALAKGPCSRSTNLVLLPFHRHDNDNVGSKRPGRIDATSSKLVRSSLDEPRDPVKIGHDAWLIRCSFIDAFKIANLRSEARPTSVLAQGGHDAMESPTTR
jgi:hypothetical protein